MIKAWAREAGVQKEDRRPITPEILAGPSATWKKLYSFEFEACLFHAASLTVFLGAFRVSELVAQSKADSSYRALLYQDM